ncbi:MAG: hypothetical protein P8J45_03850 [Phycisphaerales bacterium]|nr:hypothetical protein [Phycisphaerales bacterium]
MSEDWSGVVKVRRVVVDATTIALGLVVQEVTIGECRPIAQDVGAAPIPVINAGRSSAEKTEITSTTTAIVAFPGYTILEHQVHELRSPDERIRCRAEQDSNVTVTVFVDITADGRQSISSCIRCTTQGDHLAHRVQRAGQVVGTRSNLDHVTVF